MEIDVLDLGGRLPEVGVARMPCPQLLDKRERVFRLLFVPEIDQVQLVIGLAAHEKTSVAGSQYLRQTLGAVATW
jgi:hypothetical protein